MPQQKKIAFNPFQLRVISHRAGYAVCMAAPGSGKTAVIIARIRKLLNEGVLPEQILSLTFTKEGAKEMAERAGLKDVEHKRHGHKHKLFTTFHSWALAFIKAEAEALPFPVHKDWHGLPSPLCLPLEAARTMANIVKRIPDIEWKDAASFTSRMKRMGLSPAQAYAASENAPLTNDKDYEKETLYIQAYAKYEEALKAKGLLDFDSIVIETANLLERNPDVRARWQFQHLQVDEAQDTDSVQWRIVKAMSEQWRNALGVGDENQGMYSWRGSESNLAAYFTGLFPDAVMYPLPVNYRSTGSIVAYCKVIAPIQNETVTGLTTPNATGAEPEFALYPMEDKEAKACIEKAQYLAQFEPDSTHDSHGKLSIAIITRTNRQLAAFEDAATTRNIPYKLLAKSGFWTQPEVKDVVALAAAIAMPSDNAILRMLTVKCEATKYLRKQDTREQASALTMLQRYQQDYATGEPLHKCMTRFQCGEQGQDQAVREIGILYRSLRMETSTLHGKAALQRVLDRFGILSMYDVVEDEDEKKNFDNDPRDNVLKLLEYAGRYPTIAQFYEYTQRVRRANLARTNCLILSTIHAAKGKEWATVFVAGVNEGMLPHKKAADEQEEHKIYFVACSRAAKRLFVSASGVPSELIKDRVPTPAEAAKIKIDLDPYAGFQLRSS